jgi:hypothetical protein
MKIFEIILAIFLLVCLLIIGLGIIGLPVINFLPYHVDSFLGRLLMGLYALVVLAISNLLAWTIGRKRLVRQIEKSLKEGLNIIRALKEAKNE